MDMQPQPQPSQQPGLLAAQPQAEPSEATRPEKGKGGLTITAEAVGNEIMANAEPNMQEAIKVIVNAGMNVLFQDGESHHAIFDGINTHDEIPISDELGAGATNLALEMFNQSGGNMPQEAIVPAGTILLAKVFEFVNETGIEAVTDEDFAEALELFMHSISDKLGRQGEQPGGGQPEAMPPTGQPPHMPPAQGGLLQQPGGMPQ